MRKRNLYGLPWVLILSILTITISCVPVTKLNYFNDLSDLQEPAINPRIQKVIMPFDKIYIKVLSIDEKTNQLFNSTDSQSSASLSGLIGNIVDEAGNINYPYVGKINVGGLTLAQAGLKIEEALGQYVSKSAVIVKFIDNNITVMGEVQRQGVFSLSQDKTTIYEALALGGGLTKYGDRGKVILIRQEGEKILHYKLDLTNSRIADKNYYYIQPNDIIIVEPLKNISSSYGNNTLSMLITSVSLILTILIYLGIK
jgi:polysaccharide export outer membrane protein